MRGVFGGQNFEALSALEAQGHEESNQATEQGEGGCEEETVFEGGLRVVVFEEFDGRRTEESAAKISQGIDQSDAGGGRGACEERIGERPEGAKRTEGADGGDGKAGDRQRG